MAGSREDLTQPKSSDDGCHFRVQRVLFWWITGSCCGFQFIPLSIVFGALVMLEQGRWLMARESLPNGAFRTGFFQMTCGRHRLRLGAREMINGFLGARRCTALAGLASFLMVTPALAELGQSSPWQLGFQEAVTPIARQIHVFHDYLMILITIVSIFVLGLLIYVAVKFNAKANPKPSRTTHNTTLEVLWTVVPIVILLVIAVPSFRLLFAQYDFPKADVTVKAIGNQWYWTYEYPDQDNMTFDSVLVEEADLKPGQPRLLTTDNDVVVPVNKNVHILVTATDVLHNWTIPAFGVKVDAVPGRLIRTWFRAEKTGTFYGQCSELCGARHAFMPITVRVVSDAEYASWLVEAKKKFATAPTTKKVVQGDVPAKVAQLKR